MSRACVKRRSVPARASVILATCTCSQEQRRSRVPDAVTARCSTVPRTLILRPSPSAAREYGSRVCPRVPCFDQHEGTQWLGYEMALGGGPVPTRASAEDSGSVVTEWLAPAYERLRSSRQRCCSTLRGTSTGGHRVALPDIDGHRMAIGWTAATAYTLYPRTCRSGDPTTQSGRHGRRDYDRGRKQCRWPWSDGRQLGWVVLDTRERSQY